MRKKSIFSQLFVLTVSVILFSFLIMGIVLYGLLGSYLTEEKESDLLNVAENLASFTVKQALTNPSYSKENYQMSIDVLSQSSGTTIAVLNTDGSLIAANSGAGKITFSRDLYEGVMKGDSLRHFGTLGGTFTVPTMTVGIPIKLSQSQIIGGVFVSLPVPEINEFRTEILKIIILPLILVLMIVLIAIYGTSARITRPLKALRKAARDIADGHLDRRVHLDETTEIGELGDSFNKMATALQQQDAMRSSFIANISHDLRTPMTTISGFVEGIMDGTIPPEKEKQYLAIVLDETKRLSRLVTNLLDVSKMEQGNFTIEKRVFDMNEMIRLSVIKQENRITKKNIHLTVNFQTDGLPVLADKDAISRVLSNLLDNAVKFTDEGGFIDVSAGLTDSGKVFVSVQNSGIGIDPEDLAHVFDRFYKSDKSRSLDTNGTGLGLFIVKSILTHHNESIWAESQPGEFTRFTFTLSPAPTEKNGEVEA